MSSFIEVGFVEEIEFEVDEGKGFLTISGDFVDVCENYLNDEKASGLMFRIDALQAYKLVKELHAHLD